MASTLVLSAPVSEQQQVVAVVTRLSVGLLGLWSVFLDWTNALVAVLLWREQAARRGGEGIQLGRHSSLTPAQCGTAYVSGSGRRLVTDWVGVAVLAAPRWGRGVDGSVDRQTVFL